VGILYGPVESRGGRGCRGVFSFGTLGGFGCLSFKAGRTGDGASDSQSDRSVLAMGESGLYGGKTSPGTVTRRVRDFCKSATGMPDGRGGFNVRRCVDVPSSIFRPLRDRLTSGDCTGSGVVSREGGFGRACSLLMMLLRRL
jgi:hypothetical protein